MNFNPEEKQVEIEGKLRQFDEELIRARERVAALSNAMIALQGQWKLCEDLKNSKKDSTDDCHIFEEEADNG